MNPLQHYEVSKESLEGIFYGQVIQNEDTEGLYRIKVRVRGVYDEPVKKEHIPWAVPVMESDRVPELGSEVAVTFDNGDLERPSYMPAGFLTKQHIQRLLGVYEQVVDAKKSARRTGVSVAGGTWDEPETESEAVFSNNKQVRVYPDGVASEDGEGVDLGDPESGMVQEYKWEDGEQMWSVYHSAGTWFEMTSAGGLISHIKQNLTEVVEGDTNELTEGTRRIRIDQNLLVEAGQGITFQVGDSKIIIDNTGQAKVEGPQFTVSGLAAPTPGEGAFNCIPVCPFNAAPHVGKTAVSNT